MMKYLLFSVTLLLAGVAGCSGDTNDSVQDPAPRPLIRVQSGGVVQAGPRSNQKPDQEQDQKPNRKPAASSGGREIMLFSTGWFTPEVSEAAEGLGFQPIPLMTHRFHQDMRNKRYDDAKFRRRLWLTSAEIGIDSSIVTWAGRGAPPRYTGWIDIDYEKWGFEAMQFPERFTDEEIDFRVNEYRQIAETARELRPGVQVCIHGATNFAKKPRQREIVTRICESYDAVSPSIFPRLKQGCPDVRKGLAVLQTRTKFSTQLRDETGIKVFPVVRKRYIVRTGEHKDKKLIMPAEVQEAFIKMLLDHDVDGIIVYSTDARKMIDGDAAEHFPDVPDMAAVDRTDTEYFELVKRVVERHGRRIVPAAGTPEGAEAVVSLQDK